MILVTFFGSWKDVPGRRQGRKLYSIVVRAGCADVRFFDTGHFALETHAQPIALAMREFLSLEGDSK